ncbi:hypothetical protein AHF37_03255 [Paragonimus kellicotti]|nr:hypothetical protein AHF37_03255 [Paragonimus kellicotti]
MNFTSQMCVSTEHLTQFQGPRATSSVQVSTVFSILIRRTMTHTQRRRLINPSLVTHLYAPDAAPISLRFGNANVLVPRKLCAKRASFTVNGPAFTNHITMWFLRL